MIPVGVIAIGFVGYQTFRAGMDTEVTHRPAYTVDTTTAESVVNGNVLTVRPRIHHAPVRVALAPGNAKPEASPSETPSPGPSPSEKATPTPAPSKAPKKPSDKPATPEPAATEIAYEPVHQKIAKPVSAHPRSLAAVPGRLASTTTGADESSSSSGQSLASQPQSDPGAAQPALNDAPVVASAEKPAVADKPAVAVAEGPIDASDRVVEARMSYAASPEYPDIAREQGARGTSVVLVTVNENGSVTHMTIGSSSGSSSLDRSALAAARASRYMPPKVDGKPAIETYRIVYDFAP